MTDSPSEASSEQAPQTPAPHPNFFVRQWRGWIKQILIVVIIVTAARSMIADWNDVPSGSMLPSIQIGDRIVVNKLAYDVRVPFTTWRIARWSQPSRGDVITFWDPTSGIRMVKRAIGVPGDTIQIADGKLSITDAQGQPVSVTYQQQTAALPRFVTLKDRQGRAHRSAIFDVQENIDGRAHDIQFTEQRPIKRNYGPVTLGPDEFWAMGDNRDNSRDSRFFRDDDHAIVNAKDITGHAFAVAWSLDESWIPRWNRFFKALN